MISFVQVLGIIFSLAMLYGTFINYKKKGFGKVEFYFWEIVWCILLLIIVFPRFSDRIVQKMGFVRTLDLLVIGAIVILTFFSFYNYVGLKRMKNNMEEKIRDEAIKELEEKI